MQKTRLLSAGVVAYHGANPRERGREGRKWDREKELGEERTGQKEKGGGKGEKKNNHFSLLYISTNNNLCFHLLKSL